MTARLINLRNEFIGRMPAHIEHRYSIFIGGEWIEISKAENDAAFTRSCKDRTSVEAAFIANQIEAAA